MEAIAKKLRDNLIKSATNMLLREHVAPCDLKQGDARYCPYCVGYRGQGLQTAVELLKAEGRS